MVNKTVIIVDDEHLARRSLRHTLEKIEGIEVVAECENGIEAIKKTRELNPDILFIDIQMPKLSGFDVVEILGNEAPDIVFVTAYDEYAVQAFEIHAIDYILKLASVDRIKKTLQRIKAEHSSKIDIKQIRSELYPNQKFTSRILVSEKNEILIIPVEDVVYMESQDDYILIRTLKSDHLKYERLHVMENQLNPARFCRVHRSYIVNLKYIKKLENVTRDSKVLFLSNGQKIPVSRSGYERLMKVI